MVSISFRHDESDCYLAWGPHPSSSRGDRIPSNRAHHPDPTSLSLLVAPRSCSGHLFLALVLGRLVLASGLACLGWSGAERQRGPTSKKWRISGRSACAGRQAGRGGKNDIPAACFWRIISAALSRERWSSVPLWLLPDFCMGTSAARSVSSPQGSFSLDDDEDGSAGERRCRRAGVARLIT